VQVFQADDVVAHQLEHRRMQARVGQALDLIDVVLGGQLAGAGVREVAEAALVDRRGRSR
jgi:hypothetical protein